MAEKRPSRTSLRRSIRPCPVVKEEEHDAGVSPGAPLVLENITSTNLDPTAVTQDTFEPTMKEGMAGEFNFNGKWFPVSIEKCYADGTDLVDVAYLSSNRRLTSRTYYTDGVHINDLRCLDCSSSSATSRACNTMKQARVYVGMRSKCRDPNVTSLVQSFGRPYKSGHVSRLLDEDQHAFEFTFDGEDEPLRATVFDLLFISVEPSHSKKVDSITKEPSTLPGSSVMSLSHAATEPATKVCSGELLFNTSPRCEFVPRPPKNATSLLRNSLPRTKTKGPGVAVLAVYERSSQPRSSPVVRGPGDIDSSREYSISIGKKHKPGIQVDRVENAPVFQVRTVRSGAAAAALGVKVGDEIMEVNGVSVENIRIDAGMLGKMIRNGSHPTVIKFRRRSNVAPATSKSGLSHHWVTRTTPVRNLSLLRNCRSTRRGFRKRVPSSLLREYDASTTRCEDTFSVDIEHHLRAAQSLEKDSETIQSHTDEIEANEACVHQSSRSSSEVSTSHPSKVGSKRSLPRPLSDNEDIATKSKRRCADDGSCTPTSDYSGAQTSTTTSLPDSDTGAQSDEQPSTLSPFVLRNIAEQDSTSMMKCPICMDYFDHDSEQFKEKHLSSLPVHSMACSHSVCCSCLYSWQVIELGRHLESSSRRRNPKPVPKWMKCPTCKASTAFNAIDMPIDLFACASIRENFRLRAEIADISTELADAKKLLHDPTAYDASTSKDIDQGDQELQPQQRADNAERALALASGDNERLRKIMDSLELRISRIKR